MEAVQDGGNDYSRLDFRRLLAVQAGLHYRKILKPFERPVACRSLRQKISRLTVEMTPKAYLDSTRGFLFTTASNYSCPQQKLLQLNTSA